ncbi:hypothetical protein [Nostoc sp. LPT]|uniref:hypothetical protein n=1 Tax=Nostoc sp. LPT TaxID=2815387 RepID=UPI001D9E8065|nr:hypothetical protein [Nostoc sp. LPT]MBN4004633.1 hypothetical protein [Nostoc sp. LPT]
MSSGKSQAKFNPIASFFSRERGKIKASPLQGYPLVTSFLTFVGRSLQQLFLVHPLRL